eukprot:4953709-Prymnesium_polylepis.1
MLGIVGEVARRLVVGRQRRHRRRAEAELIEEPTKINTLLGRLADRHDLRLTRRQRHAGLLLARPRDGRE